VVANGFPEFAFRLQSANHLQAFRKSLAADMFEIAVEVLAWRDIELRKGILDLIDFGVAALGDRHGPLECVWNLAEELVHLVRRLYVKLIDIKFEALLVVNGRRRLYAQQDFMGIGILAADVVAIIRGDQWNLEVILKPQKIRTNLLLERKSLILNLQKETSASKNVLVGPCSLPRSLVLSSHQVLAELASQTA